MPNTLTRYPYTLKFNSNKLMRSTNIHRFAANIFTRAANIKLATIMRLLDLEL
jgi:hypothetical protein